MRVELHIPDLIPPSVSLVSSLMKTSPIHCAQEIMWKEARENKAVSAEHLLLLVCLRSCVSGQVETSNN